MFRRLRKSQSLNNVRFSLGEDLKLSEQGFLFEIFFIVRYCPSSRLEQSMSDLGTVAALLCALQPLDPACAPIGLLEATFSYNNPFPNIAGCSQKPYSILSVNYNRSLIETTSSLSHNAASMPQAPFPTCLSDQPSNYH